MDESAVELLASACGHVLKGSCTEGWGASGDYAVKLLKKGDGRLVSVCSQFRPIPVLPVLLKWFSRVLLEMVGPRLAQLRVPQFAFRRGHQAPDTVYILRASIDRHDIVRLRLWRWIVQAFRVHSAWVHSWRGMRSVFDSAIRLNLRRFSAHVHRAPGRLGYLQCCH